MLNINISGPRELFQAFEATKKLVSELSYRKYSRKCQFCLILLPFPRVSEQLYGCFIQVFGIKLSLSLMGIKI